MTHRGQCDARAVGAAFDRIAALDDRFHFCEDFGTSGPVDRAQVPADGPLQGRIVGVKSNMRVAGQAWTAGIAARAGLTASGDAAMVARVRAAGAVVLSRLTMDEGALGAATDNPHFGRCDNPAWPGHSTGGSSGGSAAAVAAGAVDASLGSDTLGSVRIPAAYCGVYGLKLGAASVNLAGVMPLAPRLDALGILARTPAMLRRLLEVLMPHVRTEPITGWSVLPPASLADLSPATRDALDLAMRRMRGLLGPPGVLTGFDLPALRKDAFVLTEVAAVGSLGNQPGLSPALEELIAYGRRVTPARLEALRARLDGARDLLCHTVCDGRVAVMPTVAGPGFAHGTRPPAGQADFTAPANIAGLPALAIPMASAGAPVSVQIVGPPGSELDLVGLGARIGGRSRLGAAQ